MARRPDRRAAEPDSGILTRRPPAMGAGIVLVVLAVVALMALRYVGMRPRPSAWRVTDRALVVSDQEGEELWRASFEQSVQVAEYDGDSGIATVIEDVDGDGSVETLFVYKPTEYGASDLLICFDSSGEQRWHFAPRGPIRTGTEIFENAYHIANFRAVDLSDGRKGVLVVSIHYLQYPTQIALLSASDGTLLADYWHAGHIGVRPAQLVVNDYDGDGRTELYAAGISNSYDQATLVVLDLEGMSGASEEQTPEYQLQGFAPPNEIARILFPRSSMSSRFDPYNVATRVWLTTAFISVGVSEKINEPSGPLLIYHLQPDFTLDHVVPSSSFEAVHHRLLDDGILNTTLGHEMELFQNLTYLTEPERTVAGQ